MSAFLIMFCSAITYSQNQSTNFEVGDVFTIAEVEHNDYNHINFPRANCIIKKGGVPHYKTKTSKKLKWKSPPYESKRVVL